MKPRDPLNTLMHCILDKVVVFHRLQKCNREAAQLTIMNILFLFGIIVT